LGHIILPPSHNLGVGEKSFGQVVTQLYRFTGLISSACDQYVQYLLVGSNPSILNQHRRGLPPWRSWFDTSHSPPFPTDNTPLSPKAPARSQVDQLLPHETNRNRNPLLKTIETRLSGLQIRLSDFVKTGGSQGRRRATTRCFSYGQAASG
jgi:hypothetical protein